MSTILPVLGSVPPQKDKGVLLYSKWPFALPGARICGMDEAFSVCFDVSALKDKGEVILLGLGEHIAGLWD